MAPAPETLSVLSPDDALTLRDFFEDAGYTETGFRSRPLLRELPTRRTGNLPYVLNATTEPTVWNTLVRMFVWAIPVHRDKAEQILPADILSIILKCGLARWKGSTLEPTAMLIPVEHLLVAADPMWRIESDESASDMVLWPNQTTRMLQYFALQRPAGSTLDLGTGNGVIALLVANQSSHVIATDLSARAIEFARFNVALNGIDNIDCRVGDTFEPVNDLKFDHIVANPPFFVGPSSDLLYCENPMELDLYCRRVVREGAALLNEGGFLQMVCEWVQVHGQPWQERLAEWVEGTSCDAWVLRTYAGDGDTYAHERTKDRYAASPEQATEKFERWIAHFRQKNVEQVHGGLFALRRRSGQNWLRIEEGRVDSTAPFGDSVAQIFDTQSVLAASPSDEQLLATRPQMTPGVMLDQQSVPEDGVWAGTAMNLKIRGPLPATVPVEWPVAQFLARCDGRRTLGELTDELAALVKAPADAVRAQCCGVIRKLAERRFILL
jgi:methylase of polypeptide subunit release factors